MKDAAIEAVNQRKKERMTLCQLPKHQDYFWLEEENNLVKRPDKNRVICRHYHPSMTFSLLINARVNF